MKRTLVAEGNVEMNDKKYRYEFHSDNKDGYVKIFHPGVKGNVTQFKRNDKIGLRLDMENALTVSGVL
jgi:hypothetical protein